MIDCVIAGCGALGSWIGLWLANPEIRFTLIDDDRVGEENIATSAYHRYQIGSMKIHALGEMMYHKGRAESIPMPYTLERQTTVLKEADLIIDAFDNAEARALTCGLRTVHVGVTVDRTGAVTWDEDYSLPISEFPRGQNPVCTNHLGSRIILITALAAVNAIQDYLSSGSKRSFLVLENMKIVS